jgi:hypothetical protein
VEPPSACPAMDPALAAAQLLQQVRLLPVVTRQVVHWQVAQLRAAPEHPQPVQLLVAQQRYASDRMRA